MGFDRRGDIASRGGCWTLGLDQEAGKRGACVVPTRFSKVDPDMRPHGVARRKRNSASIAASAPTVVSEIDHCVGEGLECVVQLTEAIETKQQTPELVFPSEYTFNRLKPLFEYCGLKSRLAAPLGPLSAPRIRVDVGDHAAVEDGLAVRSSRRHRRD